MNVFGTVIFPQSVTANDHGLRPHTVCLPLHHHQRSI